MLLCLPPKAMICMLLCVFTMKKVNIESLRLEKGKTIKTVTSLEVSAKTDWKQTDKGLEIAMSDYPVSEIPVIAFKITY